MSDSWISCWHVCLFKKKINLLDHGLSIHSPLILPLPFPAKTSSKQTNQPQNCRAQMSKQLRKVACICTPLPCLRLLLFWKTFTALLSDLWSQTLNPFLYLVQRHQSRTATRVCTKACPLPVPLPCASGKGFLFNPHSLWVFLANDHL